MPPQLVQAPKDGIPAHLMQPPRNEPSVGELLGSLANTTASLVKQEVHLASTELAQKTSDAARAVGMIALGGAVLQVGIIVLAFALVAGLGAVIPMWLSAVVLGAAVTLGGGTVFTLGLGAIRRLDPVPRQTLQTLKDDAVWAKEQLR